MLTATIDTTNNSGGTQVRSIQGGKVYAEEPGVGSGKTALSASDYNPQFNATAAAGSFIGEADPTTPGNEIGFIDFLAANVTIASGSITATTTYQTVDTESAAASDDLDTISLTSNPDILIIRPASTTRTVVIKHGTGNITTTTASDITLDTNDKGALLVKFVSVWIAIPLL